jgi:hypothetical protein
MIKPVRQEILRQLEELSELAPDDRFGTLIAKLAFLAAGSWDQALSDLEDEHLLTAIQQHRAKVSGVPQSAVSGQTNGNGAQSSASGNSQEPFPAIGTSEWGLMNRRRAELIHKKHRQGLTPEEQTEYERLQALSRAALDQSFPRPGTERSFFFGMRP